MAIGGVGDGDGVEQMDEFEEIIGDDDDDEEEEEFDERLDAKRDAFTLTFVFAGGVAEAFIIEDERDANRVVANNSLDISSYCS